MLYYKIADVRVGIEEVSGIPRIVNFEPFLCDPGPVDIEYAIKPYSVEKPPFPPADTLELVSWDIVNRLYVGQDKLYKCIAMQSNDTREMWFEQQIGSWNRAIIYIPDNWLDFIGFGNAFSFEKTLLPFGCLMLHCALIEYDGYGIAFSAPSQTGKSTQAGLWEKHKGARILNGDRAILRNVNHEIFAFGSPYAGSSNLFIKRKVPLRAIIMLEQAKENIIRPIPQGEGLGLFIEQSAIPLWQPELFEMGLKTLEAIIVGVPMYRLSCLPDEGAVESVFECLKL